MSITISVCNKTLETLIANPPKYCAIHAINNLISGNVFQNYRLSNQNTGGKKWGYCSNRADKPIQTTFRHSWLQDLHIRHTLCRPKSTIGHLHAINYPLGELASIYEETQTLC